MNDTLIIAAIWLLAIMFWRAALVARRDREAVELIRKRLRDAERRGDPPQKMLALCAECQIFLDTMPSSFVADLVRGLNLTKWTLRHFYPKIPGDTR